MALLGPKGLKAISFQGGVVGYSKRPSILGLLETPQLLVKSTI